MGHSGDGCVDARGGRNGGDCGVNVEIHSRVLDSLIGLFDVPLIQNDLRGLYAEHLIAELLGDEWNAVGSAWAGWDLEHEDGTKIEVKSSAAKQSWEPSKNGKSLPAFNIKASKFHWREDRKSVV